MPRRGTARGASSSRGRGPRSRGSVSGTSRQHQITDFFAFRDPGLETDSDLEDESIPLPPAQATPACSVCGSPQPPRALLRASPPVSVAGPVQPRRGARTRTTVLSEPVLESDEGDDLEDVDPEWEPSRGDVRSARDGRHAHTRVIVLSTQLQHGHGSTAVRGCWLIVRMSSTALFIHLGMHTLYFIRKFIHAIATRAW